jgi:drug/metabolite transporter (DMT)-like permease
MHLSGESTVSKWVLGMMALVTTLLPTRTSDRMLILAAALLFSTGGAAVKLCAMTNWQVASFRSGIAAFTLALLLPAARRGWNWRIVMVAGAYGMTMITFVLANKLTTSANAVFLQSTAPLYILLLGPLILGEAVGRRQILFMASLVVGMALIFTGGQQAFETAPDPLRGNLVGIATGIFWALTIIGLRWLARPSDRTAAGNPAAAATLLGNLIAFALALPLALPVADASRTDWFAVVFLGVFQIGVAYVLIVRGVRRAGALEVSLLVLLEPVLNPIWSWLLHGEAPSANALFGGAVIILATAAYTWFSKDDAPGG